MDEMHPSDMDLALLAEGAAGPWVAEHLRRCARCRAGLARHHRLGDQLRDTLARVAGAAPLPCPQWDGVREAVLSGRRSPSGRWRTPALAGLVLALGLTFSISPCLGAAVVSQTLAPEAVTAPPPAAMAEQAGRASSGTTATPSALRQEAGVLLTPACVLPPTPAQAERADG